MTIVISMSEHWSDDLVAMDACEMAVEWARTQPSLAQAWRRCKRGDWMLWYAGQKNARREDLVLAACGCARLALRYVPEGEDRPRIAIETAEAWARGEVTLSEVRADASPATADAFYAASAYSAYSAASAYAAYYHAASAAYAAAASASAPYSYADLAATYTAHSVEHGMPKGRLQSGGRRRRHTLAECARIVRRVWPTAGDVA